MAYHVRRLFSTVFILSVACMGGELAANERFAPSVQLRRPVAIVVQDKQAMVANRSSGTISILDLASRSVVEEVKIGERLSALAALPKTNCLLALDEKKHQLILLEMKLDSNRISVIQRLDVPHTPVHLAISADGKVCAVASLWSRRVTLVDSGHSKSEDSSNQTAQHRLKVRKTFDLPFAPRMLQFTNRDRQLIVADAFGGRMASIETTAGELKLLRPLDGHNIRGLAIAHDGAELHVTHQTLDSNSATTHEHVFWGSLMKNFVRSIPLEQLLTLQNGGNPFTGSTYPLGHPSGATGDPGQMLVTARGEAALLLSGVNEVAMRRRPREPFVRRKVGQRPTGMALSTDQKQLFIANMFDDSVSVINLTTFQVGEPIALGPQPELTPSQRGERHFFDARLSLDGWYSCHSCHTDGHANGLLNDNFGDNYFGDPKRIPSLLGVGRTHPWAWNGKTASLAEQVNKSVTVTMQGEKPSAETVDDLVAYLKTLEPPPGIGTARRNIDQELVTTGRALFGKLNCNNCHAHPTYTSDAVYDVGLADKSGNENFNPPSLLGVSQRSSFFHDGRAKSLRDVLTTHQHNLTAPLKKRELAALVAFLESL